ncbi:MAG: TRAP transporter large permease [Spirochaetia bacterium]
MSPLLSATLLLVIFVALLIIGVPISVGIIVSSIVTVLSAIPFSSSLQYAAQRMFGGIDSFALLAIPFFILAGNIMNRGGIALRLVNLGMVLSGKMPGSLAHANIISNMLFGSISGSSVAAAAAVGSTMGPLQDKEGYDKAFSAAVNIASAPTGLLIPPSGTFIVYSLVSGGVSVAALFMAGYIPGLLMGFACMAVAFVMALKNKYYSKTSFTLKEGLVIFGKAVPSLMLIVIVIGGIVTGIFTATEGAAVAVAYSLILSFTYRTLSIKDLWQCLVSSGLTSGIVLFLIAASSVMSWVLSLTGIPQAITQAMLSISDNKIVLLLLMNLILVCVGTFMDITPAILIFTPILLPVATQIGLDPLHFGIMMVFNMCLGNITPPVGSVLFVGVGVAKIKLEPVVKQLVPFFIAIFIALLLVTYIPALSLFLPKLLNLI